MNQESTTPAQPEVALNTESDAAQALLARWGVKDESPTDDASESEAQAADATETTDAEQPESGTADAEGDEQEQPEEVEIDVAGDKFKFPKTLAEQAERIQRKVKDLEAGTTRKFQEAAEIRKALEVEREQVAFVQKLANSQTELLADFRAVQKEVDQLTNIDWNGLSDADPVQAQKAMARLMSLQNAQQRIGSQLQQASRQMSDAEHSAKAARMQHGVIELSKLLPTLNDSTKKELAEYIGSRNLTPEGKDALYDAETIAAWHDAKKYRDLMAKQPGINKRAQAAPPPAVKATASGTKQSMQKAKAQEVSDRLRKTGRTEDAAAVLLARMRKG